MPNGKNNQEQLVARIQNFVVSEIERYFDVALQQLFLNGELHEYFSKLVVDSVHSVVYSAYGVIGTGEPVMYIRRYGNGGLGDITEVQTAYLNGVIHITNTAQCNGGSSGSLEDIVMSGNGYDFRKGKNTFGSFRKPRDFYKDAFSRYDGGVVVGALVRALNQSGAVMKIVEGAKQIIASATNGGAV